MFKLFLSNLVTWVSSFKCPFDLKIHQDSKSWDTVGSSQDLLQIASRAAINRNTLLSARAYMDTSRGYFECPRVKEVSSNSFNMDQYLTVKFKPIEAVGKVKVYRIDFVYPLDGKVILLAVKSYLPSGLTLSKGDALRLKYTLNYEIKLGEKKCY